jgi:hypothetical protein
LHYFYYILNAENITIEKQEHYQKQSFKNRTQILTANGILNLSIPIINSNKQLITDVEISYKENWQKQHWRAIISAYKNSPYFEFFEDDLKQFYESEFQNLFQYNLNQLQLILNLLKQPKQINFTHLFEKKFNGIDLRQTIHPKLNFKNDSEVSDTLNTTYYQTFESKYTFTPNLSVLDVLFNIGLDTINLLKK